MGRLAGFSYREVARKLRALGFRFDRAGPASHEIWRNVTTGAGLYNVELSCCLHVGRNACAGLR